MRYRALILGLTLVALFPSKSGSANSFGLAQASGYIERDTSCSPATHVLKTDGPCPGALIFLYHPHPERVDKFVGQHVMIRGAVLEATCPMFRAHRILVTPAPAPCTPQPPQ